MLTLDTESYGNGAIEEYRSLGPISEQIYLCPRFLRCMRSLSHCIHKSETHAGHLGLLSLPPVIDAHTIFQAKNSSLTSKIHTC